ncbi:MAG: oligosaccharide flippase family protein [Anaerolineae bacterium]|nr:oligosaccharide flippase family protein [Anaerolineae bacterium]
MRRRLPDLLILVLLFVLPLILFWPQTLGGRTLLPTENLYQYEPFATYREVVKAPAIPHNALLSDLVLENFQWKTFIRESIAQGEIPLWNPHQFSGIPFLAAGQQSALYPFSLIYYVLPLTSAYGWFTVSQLWLAGALMYAFMRGLQVGRFGSTLAGVVYQLSATFVISAVFPMIIGAAAWIPLVLLMTEFVIQQRPFLRGRPASAPWVVIGAIALGCNILAGHVEITYYTLIITAYYAAMRLGWMWWRARNPVSPRTLPRERGKLKWIVGRGLWLAMIVGLGIGLGAIQFIPLFELVSVNYRDGRTTLDQVLGWGHPLRDLVQFAMPNFYGSPAHHEYFDLFSQQTMLAPLNNQTIDWGIKNYVEGALYLGILPLALAVYSIVHVTTNIRFKDAHRPFAMRWEMPDVSIFAILTIISLTFMFGLPTYALLYYGFPGINQLHSPFRWILAVTLGIATLAGLGADYLEADVRNVVRKPAPGQGVRLYSHENAAQLRKIIRFFGYILGGVGGFVLLALLASRVFYPQIEPLIQRIVENMAKAGDVFSDAQMFYSYQFTNVLVFGLMTLGAGIVFLLAGRDTKPDSGEGDPLRLWHIVAVGLVAVDLMIASWGFNPASDPALLDFTPPAIEWLQNQPGEWRYTTLDDPTQPALMNANVGWRYGLDDIRGYESIIPKQYVDFMRELAPQVQLDFNRVAPLYTVYSDGFDYREALQSDRLKLLNVRYVMTHKSTTIELPEWTLSYEDEAVKIWELEDTLPRLYLVPEASLNPENNSVVIPNAFDDTTVQLVSDSGRELVIHVSLTDESSSQNPVWLVVSQTYMPGWRAFIRPIDGSEQDEQALEVQLVNGNFQGVRLPVTAGEYAVRLTYSPTSFQLGLFGSFISGVLLLFVGGVYLWRLFVAPDTSQSSGVHTVARNSLAPIILNLFNRGIDFAFAFVMLRILGPEGAGIYYYAVFIFGWFDIFTNFGLNLFLTREVSRDRSQAWRLLYNTSLLRLMLMIVGVFLLVGFLAARQSTITPALEWEAIVAIGLLYIGLLPNSLSTGLSALFYAFEKAEYPAAVATVATICKASFGVAVLAMGWGIIGLAGVSIITNLVTLAVLGWSARGMMTLTPSPSASASERGEQPGGAYKPDTKLMRGMVGESWPLMLNHFLASIFFQIDVVIIEAFHGARMVGQYSVAYKWISALNVIPAFFTMALLPVMSRQAHEDRAALKRNYGLAIKLLFSTALPLAVIFTFMAYTLTEVLAGAEFLPDGAIATQLMIWSIPIGWMNSLTQYVLIALDLQRRITRSFMLAVSFNIISNLILIPTYGYSAAALTTIASELALLIPFALLLHGAMGRINWFGLLWKPIAATGVLVGVLLAGWPIQSFLALIVGTAAYLGVLLTLRPLDADELARLTPLLPGRIKRLLAPV